MKAKGFRCFDSNYFSHVMCISEKTKQYTPFMVCKGKTIECVYKVRDLLEIAKPEDLILQAWKGTWSADVFAYKMEEFLKSYEKLNS